MESQYYHYGVLKQIIHYIFFFLLLCLHYVDDLIKKLELRLIVLSVLLKIKIGHAQINVPKIGKPMSKTAFINPWQQ